MTIRLFLIFFLNISLSTQVSSSNYKSISTTSGEVTATVTSKTMIYEDIPYAMPPINDLRWRAPRTISNKVEIYPKENNFCIQRPSNLGGVESENFYTGSEDCLYLDIFTPKKSNKTNLPVMFWIHGGGNTSGLKDLYDFSKMVSKHNVIVVIVNYRLGPFGWFTHPAIQKLQFGDDKTSNFGTLDLIMALKWVNQNINKFGGDKENITIFGESAGGHNVLSLLVSKKAKNLFHKAISMSGYTTSISKEDAYYSSNETPTSSYSSSEVIKKLDKIFNINSFKGENNLEKTRNMLKNISAEDFFRIYANRESYEEIPLLTADDIVLPSIGLKESLSKKEHLNIVPTIAGSNRDEVKLWLATATYFVDLEYSFLGSLLKIPKVRLLDEDSFEAFNYYRSSAWKIRGVDIPLKGLYESGNSNLYAYRYDWDDHRRYVVADFKKLIGAAHATEIPLLAGNAKLVGGYPLSDLIYPAGRSKLFTSRNMMRFWTNFAKNGEPGKSSNSIYWSSVVKNNEFGSSYLVIDSKNNLKIKDDIQTFESLSKELYVDSRVNELEKCVILLQMFTFVGNDLYDENIKYYPGNCERSEAENFLIENASFIEY